MTTYYIEKDGRIIFYDTDEQRLRNTIANNLDYEGLEIQETERPIIDFEFADTQEYIDKQTQENNKQYYQQFINKKLQYQSAIYDTEVGFLCGKLTEQEKTTQINLLIALINQAKQFYYQQIGEN